MGKKSLKKYWLYIAVFLVIFVPPFARYQQLLAKNRALDRQMRELRAENKRLEEEKKRLETDITYVERRAREKIGVVRKDEIVIKEMPKR